jgi:dynein heavy chain 1
VRGEANKRHWIVFDGDVDPDWAENLNSVLDDNKLLTLPNGERLALTPNIRIMSVLAALRAVWIVAHLRLRCRFEAKDLNYATPATVSRCGMVWFSDDVVSPKMMFTNRLRNLKTKPLVRSPAARRGRRATDTNGTRCVQPNVSAGALNRWKQVQVSYVEVLERYFECYEVTRHRLRASRPAEHARSLGRSRRPASPTSSLGCVADCSRRRWQRR